MNLDPFVTAFGSVVVGALALFGMVRSHRQSPYSVLAERVMALETRVTALEGERDAARQERDAAEDMAQSLTRKLDEITADRDAVVAQLAQERAENHAFIRALLLAVEAGTPLPPPPPWYPRRSPIVIIEPIELEETDD